MNDTDDRKEIMMNTTYETYMNALKQGLASLILPPQRKF